jgi:hypothetical protein
MSPGIVQLTVVALFALTCGLLGFAWMRGRLGIAAVLLLVVSAAAWLVAFVMLTSDFRGASEFATCDDACTAIHYVSAVLFLCPPLFIALAALALLIVRGSRWRARRAAREGPA